MDRRLFSNRPMRLATLCRGRSSGSGIDILTCSYGRKLVDKEDDQIKIRQELGVLEMVTC